VPSHRSRFPHLHASCELIMYQMHERQLTQCASSTPWLQGEQFGAPTPRRRLREAVLPARSSGLSTGVYPTHASANCSTCNPHEDPPVSPLPHGHDCCCAAV
jgi:hypothetical protein